jgi:hypothetical protein
MLTYTGGNKVGTGTYWDVASGRRIDVSSEAVLAGAGTAQYVRMAPGVMLISGPVIGFFYAILMPMIGIATVAALSVHMVLGTLYHLAAKSVSFGWRPNNAYLSGKKKTGETK